MKNIDVLIHVSDEMDTKQRERLLSQLRNTNGVMKQEFSENKEHLLLLEYDSKVTNSLDLLNQVREQGFKSHLVGL